MPSTQTKFLAIMEQIAADRELDLVVDKRGFDNVGRIQFQSRGGFAPLLDFEFAFTADYATFKGDSLGESPRDRRWTYVVSAADEAHPGRRTLDEFVEHVLNRLEGPEGVS
jgi:hypothetical protein